MTFTPDVTEGQDGILHYDLDSADVWSDELKGEIRDEIANEAAESFYADPDTNEVYQQFDAYNQDFETLVDDFGGHEYYQNAIEWAKYSLPEEAINEYDEVMESGDLTDIAAYVQQLKETYEAAGSPAVDFTEAEQYIFDNVVTHQDYKVVAEWARETMPQDTLDQINLVFGSGDTQKMEAVVSALIDAYNSQHQEY